MVKNSSSVLVDALKKALRQCGITYAMVAKGIASSEASVKRLFANRDMSVHHLEQICDLMHLELCELLEATQEAQGRLVEMTQEHEHALI